MPSLTTYIFFIHQIIFLVNFIWEFFVLQNLPKEIQPMVPGLLVVFILGIVLSTFEFMFGKYRELSLLFLVHLDVHKLHSSLPLQHSCIKRKIRRLLVEMLLARPLSVLRNMITSELHVICTLWMLCMYNSHSNISSSPSLDWP